MLVGETYALGSLFTHMSYPRLQLEASVHHDSQRLLWAYFCRVLKIVSIV